MSQDQWIILALKIVLIADVVSVAVFTGIYTKLAKWWRDPIGRTIVIEGLLLVVLLLPSMGSLFFSFNRLTSRVSAWIDIGLFAVIAAVMAWRCVIWIRVHRHGR